mgnify:CR=1 FL=1
MLDFVDFGLYFVQNENNFKNPLLQVGSAEKSTGSGSSSLVQYYQELTTSAMHWSIRYQVIKMSILFYTLMNYITHQTWAFKLSGTDYQATFNQEVPTHSFQLTIKNILMLKGYFRGIYRVRTVIWHKTRISLRHSTIKYYSWFFLYFMILI